jgi:hypothetical protein
MGHPYFVHSSPLLARATRQGRSGTGIVFMPNKMYIHIFGFKKLCRDEIVSYSSIVIPSAVEGSAVSARRFIAGLIQTSQVSKTAKPGAPGISVFPIVVQYLE